MALKVFFVFNIFGRDHGKKLATETLASNFRAYAFAADPVGAMGLKVYFIFVRRTFWSTRLFGLSLICSGVPTFQALP